MISLPGVYISKKKDGTPSYRSSITYKNKHISLGSFEDPQKAHQAYRMAQQVTQGSDRIYNYIEGSALSFEKWVILINFRDNGLYFKTPVYLFKRYFNYYFTADHWLTFDVDDLFYMTTHKIHRRQGYYFVNDYGMQVNLMSRFGIKNHGVMGRDYRFIDGDPTNLRYDNIEILNPYHGVLLETKKNRTYYKVRIHLNGYYIVGRYKDIHRAAVAYNKAVDFVINYGISSKAYEKNFIEHMDSSTYKEVYRSIKLSKKLIELFEGP